MKYWKTSIVVIMSVLVVAAAGYFGFRSAPGQDIRTTQAPPTVPVSRGDVRLTVTAPGYVVGTKEMLLGINVAGTLAEIEVRAGETVHAGQVLARLDPTNLQVQLRQAQANLAVAQAKLDGMLAGPRAEQVAQLQANLEAANLKLSAFQKGPRPEAIAQAEANLRSAQAKLDQIKAGPTREQLQAAEAQVRLAKNQLYSTQASADAQIGSGRSSFTQEMKEAQSGVAWEQVKAAEANLSNLQAGPTREQIDQAQAAVDIAQQQLNLAQFPHTEQDIQQAQATVRAAEQALNLAKMPFTKQDVDGARAQAAAQQALVELAEANLKAAILTAPFDGTVLDVRAKPGEAVAGKAFIAFADPAAVEISASVIEEDLPLVQVGQLVEIFFDAVPEAIARGKVARIAPQRTNSDRPTYPVYIALDQVPKGVLAGMTADTSIIITQKSDVLRLPRSLVRATAGSASLDVWAEGQVEKRAVQVGLRGDVYAEVANGLKEGEKVVGQWQQPNTKNRKDQPNK